MYDIIMQPLVILFFMGLTTHRVTRLITRDVFPPIRLTREWIERKLGSEHWLAYLTQCDWCASVYVSTALTTSLALTVANALHTSWFPWPIWILIAACSSSITGLIAQMEP